MIWILVLAMLAAAGGIAYMTYSCLKLVTDPVSYTYEDLIASESKDGFADCIEAYENEWNHEDFTIEREDAIIRGEIIRNPNADKDKTKVAIVCHGHTVNRYACLKYADIFYKDGFHVVIYDERHFGKSEAPYSTLGQNEAKDLAEIIRLVRKTFSEDCILALHGESMGAATALLVLQYEKVDLVIADCPFSDTEMLFKEWIPSNLKYIPPMLLIPFIKLYGKIRFRYDVKKTSPIEAVRNSDVPICFMHGDSDRLIHHHHSERMYEVCRNSLSELHLFKGADHAMSIVSDRKGYEALFNAFLKKCGTL